MKTQKQRIFSIFAILTMAVILTCIFAACGKISEKQVPVYKGMTISRSFAKATATAALNDAYNTDSQGGQGRVEGDYDKRDDDFDQNKPFDDPGVPSIEDKAQSTLDVIGGAQNIYYADKNEDIYITVKLLNPDSYEILSFTLNGKKYSNYMFEDGSDMENLVLKVNVGDVGGIVEYTIDAIKYVDGTDIKDVRMDGDRTVKAGVRASDQTYVNVTNEQKSMTSISFDAQVVDLYSLIEKSGGYAKAVLYDGVNMLTKDIKVGEKTNIVFDNLTPNTVYQYGVVALYDNLSGNGAKLNTLYKKAVYTDTIVLFKDVQVGKESIEWGFVWNESFANKQMSAISLWQNGAKVQDVDVNATSLDGLKSNNEYTLKATYKNIQNQDESIAIEFVTCAKATPSVTISNLSSTQSTIECDVAYTDVDNVGSVTEIALYNKDSKVKSVPFATHVAFDGLESGKEYKVVVAYKYDLNDGKGEQTATYGDKYSTLVDSIVVDSLSLLNNNVVKLGEELNLRVYFTNSSEIELTGIYVNGQKATVVGGDRIESAIVKFVPTTSGLCKFAIDRVDYVINGIEVNQTIDSSVEVEYPIYKDINITYTPITISKYENTGDGVYLSFDNEDGYTVFKVNESDDFVTVDSGRIFTKDISITSIEYGYADYGHTTQNCDFVTNSWNGIHNVAALKRIYTVEDFFEMTDGYYLLMNDLDLRSTQTKAQIKLTGIFDANGHTIRGLSNVVDTSKYEYFDLFQGGSIYDATFKELYVSVDHTSNGNGPYVRPLGNAKLYNCTVKGDVVLSDSVNYGDLNIADDSTTYSLNVTIGTTMSTQKHTAANTLAKNTHIVERDDVFYFDCEVGKAFLAYANRNTADYTVEDGTFFVRSYAFADSKTLRNIIMPESVKRVGNASVFRNCIIENAVIPIRLLEQLNDEQRKQLVTLSLFGDGVTEIDSSAFSGCSSLTNVTIPDSVTSIGSGAFYGCTDLMSVAIGNSVTSIGEWAFYDCSGLTSVTIGNSVMSIGFSAFYGCSGLTSVTIPDSVTSIGNEAFRYCGRLTSIYYIGDVASWCEISGLGNLMSSARTLYIGGNKVEGDLVIPDGVTSVGDYAFYGCSGLTSVEIPDSVTSIGGYVFSGCSGLTSVHISDIAKWCAISFKYGENPLTYGHNLYVNSQLVKDLIIPDGVTSIGDYAFNGCSGLTSVEIPDSVTSIGSYAFSGCSGLTSITIPESVTGIGDYAFYNCSGLLSVAISKNTTSIGEGAFGSCGNLQYVLYDDTAMSWEQINIENNNDCLMSAKKLYNHDGKSRTYTFVTNSTQENFSMSGLYLDELPVVEKEGYEFCGWYDNQQFDGARITPPYYDDKNTVLYAKWEIIHYTIKYDFGDAMSVSKAQNNPLNPLSYTILDEIEFAKPQRKGYTFVSWDKNITKGTTGEILVVAQWVVDEYSIEYVLNGWTNSERNKTTYTIEDRSITLYDAIHDGSLFCGWYLDEACMNFVETISADELKNYTVYTNPTNFATAGLSIQNDTITGYNGTEKEISIPSYYRGKSVLKIGKDAFNSNANIRKVVIPYGITVIGDSAFYCSGLTSLDIPDSVHTIEYAAFMGCSGIDVLCIPTSVKTVENAAFKGLGIKSLTIPNGWKTIEGNIFAYCDKLTSVTIPDSVTSIGGYAFYECSSLTSVTIPNSVTSIGERAFYGCKGLTSVTIGNSVTSIGDLAFYDCYRLIEVYNKSTLSITTGSSSDGYIAYYAKNVYTNEGGSKLTTDENGYVIYTDGDEKILVAYHGTETELVLPSYITGIHQYAFYGRTGLTSATIGNSVTSIGIYAFSGCSGLASITFNGTIAQWNAISKGSYWNHNVPTMQVICTDGTIES